MQTSSRRKRRSSRHGFKRIAKPSKSSRYESAAKQQSSGSKRSGPTCCLGTASQRTCWSTTRSVFQVPCGDNSVLISVSPHHPRHVVCVFFFGGWVNFRTLDDAPPSLAIERLTHTSVLSIYLSAALCRTLRFQSMLTAVRCALCGILMTSSEEMVRESSKLKKKDKMTKKEMAYIREQNDKIHMMAENEQIPLAHGCKRPHIVLLSNKWQVTDMVLDPKTIRKFSDAIRETHPDDGNPIKLIT